MAYAGLPIKAVGDTITKPNWDTIKANFEATGVAIVTAKGDVPVATGAQVLARLEVGADDSRLEADSGEATGLVWQIVPSCRVYNDAAIDPATSTWVSLTFNAEVWDTNTMHSTVTNPGRLTVPTDGDGIYSIFGNALFDTSAVGGDTRYYGIRVLLGGATVIAQHGPADHGMDTHDMALFINAQYSLAATNYVELQVFTTWDLDILASGNISPEFGATWLRRAP